MSEAQRWAEEQFGHARLGDVRNERRLVRLASEVVLRPAGVVSRTCQTAASREGAFRWLENPAVCVGDVRDAVIQKTVRDSQGHGTVIVAVDGSSLSLSDGARTFGGVGAWAKGARGVQVMTSLAVGLNGKPLGICGQQMWIREKSGRSRRARRAQLGESKYWHDQLESVHALYAAEAPNTRPWLQMDRGADAWPLLQRAVELGACITVRAAYDRRLEDDAWLIQTLKRAPIRACRRLELPKRGPARRKKRVGKKRLTYLTPSRPARTAKLTIRAARVGLSCAVTNKKRTTVPLNAVYVTEIGRGPRDEAIEWILLTTHAIDTSADVLAIVDAYALRWRIEDFHLTWKSGLCGVEDTQLRSPAAVFKWATILAAVATRAMRLMKQSRESPDALALTEFSEWELKAIVAQRQPKGVGFEIIPTLSLAQAVRWMVDCSGYNGPWKGPPGVRIIGRALEWVVVGARALEYAAKKR